MSDQATYTQATHDPETGAYNPMDAQTASTMELLDNKVISDLSYALDPIAKNTYLEFGFGVEGESVNVDYEYRSNLYMANDENGYHKLTITGMDLVEVEGKVYNNGKLELDGTIKLTPGTYPVLDQEPVAEDKIRIGLKVSYEGINAKAVIEVHPQAIVSDYKKLSPLMNDIGDSYQSTTKPNPNLYMMNLDQWLQRR